MQDAGLDISTAANVTAMFQIGGTIGAIIVGWVMDKARPAFAIAAAYLGGGLCDCRGVSRRRALRLPRRISAAGFAIAAAYLGGGLCDCRGVSRRRALRLP